VPKDTRWDRNLSVAPNGEGLISHAGAVLLRKLADQCDLALEEGIHHLLATAAALPAST
jgi:hypothetical protein